MWFEGSPILDVFQLLTFQKSLRGRTPHTGVIPSPPLQQGSTPVLDGLTHSQRSATDRNDPGGAEAAGQTRKTPFH